MAHNRACGGLIWVPLTSFIGRAPVLFWTAFFGLVFVILTPLSPNFEVFYASRALHGFFLTSGQTIAVAFIKDIFFFHERARKIGLWALLYITSPFWGPLVGNFIVGGTGSWEKTFWFNTVVAGINLILIISFLDETWYNRTVPTRDQPPRGHGFSSRLRRLIGIWQLRHHSTYYETAYNSFRRFLMTLLKPIVLLVLLA